VKMFDAGKTRIIGLPYGEKNCYIRIILYYYNIRIIGLPYDEKTVTLRYVKPFSSDTGT